MSRVPERDLLARHEGPAESPAVRERVETARKRQVARYGQEISNAQLSSKDIAVTTNLSEEATELLNQVTERFKLSARSYFKLIKVARTIADLEESDTIESTHMAEALQYRKRDDTK